MKSLRLCVTLFCALLLSSCGEDPPQSVDHTFADGSRVIVSVEGEIETFASDGRVLLATTGGPTARNFDLAWRGNFAIWDFSRRDATEIVLPVRDDVRVVGDEVKVDYVSEDGATRGTVSISAEDGRTQVVFTLDGEASALALPLRCDDDGSFHGFGAQYGATDQRGEAFELFVTEQGIGRETPPRFFSGDEHTSYFPMPYYVDVRGFGVLAETSRLTTVDLCKTDEAVAEFEVVGDESLALTVFRGPTVPSVITQLGDHIGRPTKPPAWAWELWIGSQGGREDVMAEVDALEDAEIPVAAFWVQDWTGIRMNFGGGFGVEYRWEADDALYPDLPGMIAELHERGYKFLSYANPFVDPVLDNHFAEMRDAGLLAKNAEGEPYVFIAPNNESAHPDFTNPATQDYVRDALRAMVRDYGMDGWMTDFAEWLPLDAVLSDGTDPLAYHNLYPEAWQRVTREAMEAERPDGDWVMFARSGFTGVHDVAQIHWIGDQEADFLPGDGLPTVVPAMINLGLSGQPFVTHDIAGFSGGPSTKELFLRWTELGAFTPIMRTHEGNNKEENWSWEKDEETTAHFRRFTLVHLALKDQMETLAQEAARTGMPIVRHLMLEFPDDRETYAIADQYLLGPDLLVAPVVTEGATTRDVYLPAGAQWFHVFTGEMHEGGQTVSVDAPIGTPPVFARDADREDLRAIE